jgi:hypothetical protein
MQTETNPQSWPLQSGNGTKPNLTQGTVTSFFFKDVPDRSTTGPLAYYLPGVYVTFQGQIVQGASASVIHSDEFFGALFANVAWIQAWQGTAVRPTDNQGSQWAISEYFANGQRYAADQPGLIALSTAGTYPFSVTIWVPFSSDRTYNLEEDTSQLALLARPSQLQINVAPLSALQGLSTGATFTNLTAQASAVLVPRQELVLGTPFETILTQVVAGSGNAVTIDAFGTDTGLTGVDPGGGVKELLFLTNVLHGEGGSWSPNNGITDFTWQWRGQNFTQDLISLLQMWKRQLPQRPFTETIGNQGGGLVGSSLLVGLPYSVANTTTYGGTSPAAGLIEFANLLFWPLILGGQRPRLSALQTADSPQTFNMTVPGGFAGSHQILGRYARSWQQPMITGSAGWVAQVMAGGGGSLAAYVLGPNYGAAKIGRKVPHGKSYVTGDEQRYLPYKLYPHEVAARLGL